MKFDIGSRVVAKREYRNVWDYGDRIVTVATSVDEHGRVGFIEIPGRYDVNLFDSPMNVGDVVQRLPAAPAWDYGYGDLRIVGFGDSGLYLDGVKGSWNPSEFKLIRRKREDLVSRIESLPDHVMEKILGVIEDHARISPGVDAMRLAIRENVEMDVRAWEMTDAEMYSVVEAVLNAVTSNNDGG